jgi:hypothetical protein
VIFCADVGEFGIVIGDKAAAAMAQGESGKQDSMEPVARRNRTEAIGRSDGLAVSAFARAGFRDPALVLRWREIVGQEVANYAHPLRLTEGPSGGVLTLIAEPAAAVFLQHETRSLCARINAFLGRDAVARLRFVKGGTGPRPTARARPEPPPQVPNDDPALAFSGPERLKASLVRLAHARQRPARTTPRD